MTDRLRRRLLQLGSFILAAGLLALALYGVDLGKMITAFRQADWGWLLPLVALVLGSNLFRAWRWQILIEALPNPDASTSETSNILEASFSSIMIGYMVNYVAPRMGEVARTANMAARSRYRFSSLFGTVISERIFDTAVLGVALLSGIGLLLDRMQILHEQFLGPAWTTLASLPVGWILSGSALLLLLIAGSVLLLRSGLSHDDSTVGRFWRQTVKPALLSFKGGMMTLIRSPRRGAILVSTVGMWAGYLMMAYIPFRMLDLAAPYGIGLTDAWALMAIGALGLLVPTPGGAGSYHYITTEALVHLYGVPEASALTYAVLTHAAQFVFYILTGGIALLYEGMDLDDLFDTSSEPDGASAAPTQKPSLSQSEGQ